MLHIAFVSPYPELTRLGHSFVPQCHEKGILLEVFEAIEDKDVANLKTRADVVICRGVTGVALRRVLAPETPLIELKVTGYDVMQAIHECQSNTRNPKPYTAIGTRQMIHGLQGIMDILGLDLEFYLITSEEEARQCYKERLRCGKRTIIGGSTIVNIARQDGNPAVLIRSSEEALQQAIDEAAQMASVIIKERTVVEQTRIGLNSLAEGIIMFDDMGRITESNSAAVRHLLGEKCTQADMVGRLAEELLPGSNIGKVLSGKDDFSLVPLGDSRVLALNAFPVLVGGLSRGGVATLQTISQVQEMEGSIRNSLLQKGHRARYTFQQCLGKYKAFTAVIEKAKMYSLSQASVLVHGETGTGKEMVAQSIHNLSQRRNKPFVAINCAAFHESLLESMLFGYVAGAFTGASKEGKAGIFELAHGGTLFLDEVSEIPLSLQGRLLRVLQEQEVMRLGHDRVISVNMRVIAATNRALFPLIESGLFRRDLFYRLNILSLTLPPLRERGKDVEILAEHFLFNFCQKNGRRQIKLSENALKVLREYTWPGNIRELYNLCERLGVTSKSQMVNESEMIEALDIGKPWSGNEAFVSQGRILASSESGPEPCVRMHDLARQTAQNAVRAAGGSRSLAAERLGISRTTLWRMLKNE